MLLIPSAIATLSLWWHNWNTNSFASTTCTTNLVQGTYPTSCMSPDNLCKSAWIQQSGSGLDPLVQTLVGNSWLCHSSHPECSVKFYDCLLGCFLVCLHTINPITKLCFCSKGPPSRANPGTHVGNSTFFEWGVLMVILSPKDVRFELGDPDFSLWPGNLQIIKWISGFLPWYQHG
jgi:hypothetical protein